MTFNYLVSDLLDYASKNQDGFTVFVNCDPVTSGFVVAYEETQNSLDRKGLEACVRHAIKHDGVVGGWVNPDGRLQFDSCKIMFDLDKAIDYGRAQKQESIYYLNKGCEIKL